MEPLIVVEQYDSRRSFLPGYSIGYSYRPFCICYQTLFYKRASPPPTLRGPRAASTHTVQPRSAASRSDFTRLRPMKTTRETRAASSCAS